MGHSISAVLLKGEYDRAVAGDLGLRTVSFRYDLTMLPLWPEFLDDIAARNDLDQRGMPHRQTADSPALDGPEVAFIMAKIAPSAIYAVVETDYFGGAGDQAAVVYEGTEILSKPKRAERGAINTALRILGVPASTSDEFETIGLCNYRTFERFFKEYC